MDEIARSNRIRELRENFSELKDRLNCLRAEWFEARDRKDVNRQTELIAGETELFDEVSNVIAEFSSLMWGSELSR